MKTAWCLTFLMCSVFVANEIYWIEMWHPEWETKLVFLRIKTDIKRKTELNEKHPNFDQYICYYKMGDWETISPIVLDKILSTKLKNFDQYDFTFLTK